MMDVKYKEVVNTIKFTRDIINRNIKSGDTCVDCTLGNGNDISLLSKIVGASGLVYGFDIQKIAVDRTFKRLSNEGLIENTVLINDSHENINKYIDEKIDLFIYNLGYLPKGDKSIKTNKDSTLKSISSSLELLNENGLILITSYTGHDGGMEEKEAIEGFLIDLNQAEYNVLKYDFLNQKNFAPILYCVEKIGGKKIGKDKNN